MLVTAVAGPLITSRSAAQLTSTDVAEPESGIEVETRHKSRVVVPVYNPKTERYLLELASLLVKKEAGEIVPLAIAKAQARLDSPQLNNAIERSRNLLAQAPGDERRTRYYRSTPT